MKTRNSFVANSSSSSFIFLTEKEIIENRKKQEVERKLFLLRKNFQFYNCNSLRTFYFTPWYSEDFYEDGEDDYSDEELKEYIEGYETHCPFCSDDYDSFSLYITKENLENKEEIIYMYCKKCDTFYFLKEKNININKCIWGYYENKR